MRLVGSRALGALGATIVRRAELPVLCAATELRPCGRALSVGTAAHDAAIGMMLSYSKWRQIPVGDSTDRARLEKRFEFRDAGTAQRFLMQGEHLPRPSTLPQASRAS
jgi:hypothetical protein